MFLILEGDVVAADVGRGGDEQVANGARRAEPQTRDGSRARVQRLGLGGAVPGQVTWGEGVSGVR